MTSAASSTATATTGALTLDEGSIHSQKELMMDKRPENNEKSTSRTRKVLLKAQKDLHNADYGCVTFLGGLVANPIRQHVVAPALDVVVATDVIPAVAGAVLPFGWGDKITAWCLSVPFNAMRWGYTIVHQVEDKCKRDLLKWDREMDPLQKQDIIGWRGYFIACIVEVLSDPIARFSEWKHAAERLTGFLDETGIGDEYETAKQSPRYDDNLRILGLIQGTYFGSIARRKAVRMQSANGSNKKTPSPSELAQKFGLATPAGIHRIAKLQRYSTAAFGKDTMEAQELYSGDVKEVSLFDDNAIPDMDALQLGGKNQFLKEKVCQHVGIPASFIRYFYLGYGGDMKLLRHMIVIDEDLQAVVLVIRGTQSQSGWSIDAQGMTSPFCDGLAHAGIAAMANSLLEHSKDHILEALAERPDYPLLITGHSLGSGMACLVNILCHLDDDILRGGFGGPRRDIQCHAFGGPPVYLRQKPNRRVDEAIRNAVVYIHREDNVPNISMYNCHRLLVKLIGVDGITKTMSNIERSLLAAGRKVPSPELVRVVMNEDENENEALRPIEGAPKLLMPSSCIVWFREAEKSETTKSTMTQKYNMMICDPEKYADLGFLVSTTMWTDHPPVVYETVLNSMERTGGWEIL